MFLMLFFSILNPPVMMMIIQYSSNYKKIFKYNLTTTSANNDMKFLSNEKINNRETHTYRGKIDRSISDRKID